MGGFQLLFSGEKGVVGLDQVLLPCGDNLVGVLAVGQGVKRGLGLGERSRGIVGRLLRGGHVFGLGRGVSLGGVKLLLRGVHRGLGLVQSLLSCGSLSSKLVGRSVIGSIGSLVSLVEGRGLLGHDLLGGVVVGLGLDQGFRGFVDLGLGSVQGGLKLGFLGVGGVVGRGQVEARGNGRVRCLIGSVGGLLARLSGQRAHGRQNLATNHGSQRHSGHRALCGILPAKRVVLGSHVAGLVLLLHLRASLHACKKAEFTTSP